MPFSCLPHRMKKRSTARNTSLTPSLIVIAAVVVSSTSVIFVATIRQQIAYGIEPAPCSQCAKEFAPGQEAGIEPGPCTVCAKEFAPGQEKKVVGDPGGDFGGN